MGKRKKRIKKQYRKHGLEGESMKEFMVRTNGNVRPEQRRGSEIFPGVHVGYNPHTAGVALSAVSPALAGVGSVVSAATAAQEQGARAARTAQEAPEPIDEGETEAARPPSHRKALSECTLSELMDIARDGGFRGYSKMRKAELLKFLGG